MKFWGRKKSSKKKKNTWSAIKLNNFFYLPSAVTEVRGRALNLQKYIGRFEEKYRDDRGVSKQLGSLLSIRIKEMGLLIR